MAGRGLAVLRRSDPAADLVGQLKALTEAVELCEGRVPDEVLAEARRVVEQADRRLALSGSATVVALAGATGSGKSSMFNVLSGTDLATVGVRRPTTAHAMAATWGEDAAADLLDWLKIPRRHALERDPETAEALDGLVLLDLPDHDSTERQHRMEVDRLVQLVDMLIWVVDPQKYADAALHDRYLIPLASHAGVMMVALNQADRLAPGERELALKDLRQLLDREGLRGVDVLAVSAVTGEGMDVLRDRLARRIADKQTAARRLAADVAVAAQRLRAASGTAEVTPLSRATVSTLTSQIAEAAGVPVVTQAVGQAWRLRGGLATGWPVLAWIGKFKPDPLRRLHLDRLGAGRKRPEIDPASVGRTSLPAGSGVQKARVDTALRTLADQAAAGLTRGWADAIRRATRSGQDTLPDRVDRAIATTDLDLAGHRRWWQAVRVLQWLLVAAVLAGLAWLAAAFVLAYLQLPPLPEVRWWGFPAPTVLVIGGVLAGLLVAGLARIGVEVGARRRTARARQALRGAIATVTGELVIAPVRAEQERYEQARKALERTAG
ncbi:MAG TPA: YfjP family GTPase [Propionibacteriaceae bacterium]|nr:YfjP family GTPase [Propionibacteriaceae bacterium]